MKRKPIPTDGLTGGAVLLREAQTEYRDLIDLVRDAVAAHLHPTQKERWVNLVGIYPDNVIVRAEKQRLFQFPYTIDDDNAVKLGEPIEVKTNFVALKEAIDDATQLGDSVFIEAVGESNSGKWLIRVIKAGKSLNGNYYSDALLKESVPMFNNVRVFDKTDAEHLAGKGKSVTNLIGRLTEAKFVPGTATDTGEIQALFTFIEADGAVSKKLVQAFKRDMKNLLGFSIDANARAKVAKKSGTRVIEATKITKVHSVDLIVEPGAGGELLRMVEAVDDANNTPNQENTMLKKRMLEAIKKANPDAYKAIDPETITDEALEVAYREAVVGGASDAAGGEADDQENLREANAGEHVAVAEQIRMVEARAEMRTTIAAANLPQAAQDKLVKDFAARESFQAEDVTTAIDAEREYVGQFVESGHVDMGGFGSGIEVGDRSVQIKDMFDAFFDPSHKEHRNVGSFKEAYIMVTGDKRVTGQMQHVNQSRMREALGIPMREALNSGSFALVLGDSITRRMQQAYSETTDLQAWRNVVKVGRVNDFREQKRGRIGGYGNLPIVGESGTYNPLTSPTDDQAKIVVAKRGGTEKVTLEMIKNDDVGAIQAIPGELSLAAAHTLSEFAFGFFTDNPITYDGKALYHADHNNLFTGGFSGAEYAKHRLAMRMQTRAGSDKRMATAPKFLLLPFELEEAGYDAFIRALNNDETFVQSNAPTVISVPHWDDPDDWVTVADPARRAAVEIDFLDGQEEPELFIQDSPTAGSMFTNDVITYKIRHIYGGNVLVDGEKYTTKAIVA